jgi:O-antigen/teichoic acid export membrane protein
MAVAAAIPDFGLGVIVVRDVARQPAQAGRYLATSLALQTALAILGYAVLQAAAVAFGYGAVLRALLMFVGINLLVDAVGTAVHNQLVAAERMWPTAVVSGAHVVLLVALGAVALALGGGLWGVYAAVFAAGLARTLLYGVAMGRAISPPALEVDRVLARRLLAAGFPLGLAAFLSLGFLHADKLVTTTVLGPEATGQLTAAFVVVFGIVELLGTTVLVSVFPLMSRAEPSRDPALFQPALEPLLFFYLLIGFPAAALMVVFSEDLIGLLFGGGFGGAATVLGVMGWWVPVRMIEGALAQTLTVENRQAQVLAARTAGLTVNLGTTLALLPRIGVAGAAVGMLAGEVVNVAGLLRLISPPAGWWRRVGGRVARLALPVVALWLCLLTLHARLPVIATVAIAAAAYGISAIAAGAVTREHLRLLFGEPFSGSQP